MTNGIPVCVRPWGCTIYHLAYTVQPRGPQEGYWGKCLLCTCGLLVYRASENVTPALTGFKPLAFVNKFFA